MLGLCFIGEQSLSCSPSSPVIEDYIDIAILYQNSKKYSIALEYLETAEKFDKFNTKILYQKAVILNKINKIAKAEKIIYKLSELNSDYSCSELATEIGNYNKSYVCNKNRNKKQHNDNIFSYKN